MITRDLKMHLIHFNKDKQKLEIISSYKIDTEILGGGMSGLGVSSGSSGKQLKEIIYITYDINLQTVIIVFA